MCKYCELRHTYEGSEELTNDCQIMIRIEDGSQIYEAQLWRSVEYGTEHNAELILDHSVRLSDGEHYVETKSIPIKYCPFCGEEL